MYTIQELNSFLFGAGQNFRNENLNSLTIVVKIGNEMNIIDTNGVVLFGF